MLIAALSACLHAAPPQPIDPVDAFAAQAIEDAVLRYTTGRQPVFTGEVAFTRGGVPYSYALTGTHTDNGGSTILSLASAGTVAVSVLPMEGGYTVLLHDEARSGEPTEQAWVAAGVFSADPLADFETLTLPPTPLGVDAPTGTLSLTLTRLPTSAVTFETLVTVSRAAPVDGLWLSQAAAQRRVLPLTDGRLVRGAVVGVPLESRDSSPTCSTFYTYWRGLDVALDVHISYDLTPTLARIERGVERTEEQCAW